MKKVLFIYSPYSGERTIVSKLDTICAKYQKRGYVIIPFRYTDEDDIQTAMDMIDDSVEYILTAGGDGTVNRVVNAIRKNKIDIPIATLPTGTANDFAKYLGYSNSISKACDQVLDGEIINVDLGKANDTYFVNVLSAGLLTDVSQKTPTFLKNTFGKLAYYVGGIQELPNFRTVSVKLYNDTFYFEDKALIVFVFNGQTAGNFSIAHNASVKDGLLDVIVIKGDNLAENIQTALHFFTGSKRKYPKGVVHFKTDDINIEVGENLTFDVDGEHGPDAPLNVKCIKNGIRVIAPIKKQDK